MSWKKRQSARLTRGSMQSATQYFKSREEVKLAPYK
uniref:Uncharacterized protein n=1 Tax=Arundo donax TaxID=35708 RepID=A0A0A9A5T9_ARUDO